jgi:hypothetical protein
MRSVAEFPRHIHCRQFRSCCGPDHLGDEVVDASLRSDAPQELVSKSALKLQLDDHDPAIVQ